jgi:hypothetical protein
MRILVAIKPVDLRKGIDGLAQFCREKLTADPSSNVRFCESEREPAWRRPGRTANKPSEFLLTSDPR